MRTKHDRALSSGVRCVFACDLASRLPADFFITMISDFNDPAIRLCVQKAPWAVFVRPDFIGARRAIACG
jgi:hypothetical protein